MRSLRTALPVFATIFLVGATSHGQQPPRSLTGTWAQLVSTTALSKLPVVGDVSTRTRVYSVVTLEQNGEQLRAETHACWVRMDGDIKKVRAIVPDAMVRVIGPRVRSGKLVGSGEAQQVSFRRTVDVLGARLANPGSDPLPEDPENGAVFDEDRDGHPGVTIRIIGPIDGELRVVQRTVNEYQGAVSSDGDSIAGRVIWRTEQRVIDATNAFLRANPNSRPHPDPAQSSFQMLRIPDGADCDLIRRDHATLFPE